MRDGVALKVEYAGLLVALCAALRVEHCGMQRDGVERGFADRVHGVRAAAVERVAARCKIGVPAVYGCQEAVGERAGLLGGVRLAHEVGHVVVDLLGEFLERVGHDEVAVLDLVAVVGAELRVDSTLGGHVGAVEDAIGRDDGGLAAVGACVVHEAVAGGLVLVDEALAGGAYHHEPGSLHREGQRAQAVVALRGLEGPHDAGEAAHVPQIRADLLGHCHAVASVEHCAERHGGGKQQVVLQHLGVVLKAAHGHDDAVLRTHLVGLTAVLELHSVNHLRIGVLHKVCGGALVPHVDRLGGLDVTLDEVVVRGIENGGGGVQVDKRAVLLVIPAAVGQFPVFAGAWGDLPLGIGVHAEPAQPVGTGFGLLDIRVDHGVGRCAEVAAQVLEVAARLL